MNIECELCGEKFNSVKLKANHVRWKHKNNSSYKEKITNIINKKYDESLGTVKQFKVSCVFCKTTFFVKEREKTFPNKEKYFCSKNCSSKYSQLFVNRTNHIKSMIEFGKKIKIYPTKKEFFCVVCKSKFNKTVNSKEDVFKTCSKKCFLELLSKNSRENPNCGGELGYKHYDYKEIKMDSSWEVELARWMDKNNIKWERSRKKHMFWWTDINGNKRRYYPDFYLPELDVYLDPKNKYKLSNDQFKLDKVLKENKMVLLYGDVEKIKTELFMLKGL